MSTGQNSFETTAQEATPSISSELWALVLENKKWWLLPIVVACLAMTLIVVLGSSAAAPFIYTLF
jgi:hypothetical protein